MHETPVTLSGPEADLLSLHDWLRDEDNLRGTRVEWRSVPPEPGDMGLTDLLTVTLGAGGAGAVMARSISVWIRHRSSDLKLKITVGDQTVEVDALRLRNPEELARIVAKLLPPQP